MLAYRLRHRIALQHQVTIQDPVTGDPIITWETVSINGKALASVPAEVLTGAGKEFIESATQQAQTTARINLRWFPNLNQAWRILWDGKIYNITSIETDVTARRDYYLRCDTGVNDGQ